MTSDNTLNDNSHGLSAHAIQRDRFELLSAYLDGEVSAIERKQVEDWLATDPTVQHLYTRLLRLRQGFQSLPIPATEPVQHTVDQVLARVRRPKLRLLWGGAAAIAALFVGTLATLLPGGQAPLPQLARSPQPAQTAAQSPAPSKPLLIALDKPLVRLPKTPTDSKVPAKPQKPDMTEAR